MSIEVSYRILPNLSNYVIRRDGSIYSRDRLDRFGRSVGGRYLKEKTTRYGYKEVSCTTDDGKNLTLKVHRLIAQAFIDNPENKSQVNHINGIKHDNSIKNLEWVTPKENISHGILTGLINNKHENNPTSKLKLIDVDFIRKTYSKGGVSQRSLAKKYNVSQRTIYDVIHYLKWS